MPILRRFEPIDEFWKDQGFLWQVLQSGSDYAIGGLNVFCVNCFGKINDDGSCTACPKRYKFPENLLESAEQASQRYLASRRREKYSVSAPQIGEKLASFDLDLADERFMNVKLEKRKGSEQVVVTVGKEGEKQKAQIFVDLTKTEIRNDPTDLDPALFVDSISLNMDTKSATKSFQNAKRPLQGPYVYLQLSGISFQDSQVSFSAQNFEKTPYHLESIRLNQTEVAVDRNLDPNTLTQTIVTYGLQMPPYEDKNVEFSFIVSNRESRWRVFQNVQVSDRADDKFNLNKLTEKPSSYDRL